MHPAPSSPLVSGEAEGDVEVRKSIGVVLAGACAGLALTATVARATVHLVDGACTTSGTGTSLSCGASGPFRTLAEGVLALAPGDTLNVRGAHGSFSGIYFEELTLRNGSALPGKAIACTASQPCVIQGC